MHRQGPEAGAVVVVDEAVGAEAALAEGRPDERAEIDVVARRLPLVHQHLPRDPTHRLRAVAVVGGELGAERSRTVLSRIGKGREHRYELANGPYQSLVGSRVLIGKTLREAFPEIPQSVYFTAIERVFDTGKPLVARDMPLALPWGDRPDMAERYFNVVCQATRDGTGHIDGVATFAFEVTDQVLARRELEAMAADVARSEARLRALVDATAAIVWTATASGEIVEVSPSWLAFTGQTMRAVANLILTVVACLIAGVLGVLVARRFGG